MLVFEWWRGLEGFLLTCVYAAPFVTCIMFNLFISYYIINGRDSVTHKFLSGNFARPRLAGSQSYPIATDL